MDLNWPEHNLDRLLRDVEQLALTQLTPQGRADERLQKFDHALRPLAQRFDHCAKTLRSAYHLNELHRRQRWSVPREQRFQVDQSAGDRKRRLDQIALRLGRVRDAVARGYGAVARATPGDVVDLAQEVGGFGDSLAKMQAIVQERPDDVAQFLRSPQPSPNYGGLLATMAFLVLCLWKKARE